MPVFVNRKAISRLRTGRPAKIRNHPGSVIVFAVLLLVTLRTGAEDSGYDYVADRYFWKRMYVNGGWTLYCGYNFSDLRKTINGKIVEIDHILPIAEMVNHASCRTRMHCHETRNLLFLKMESDLHNMYPVWQQLVTFRHGLEYGEVSNENTRISNCDVEWSAGKFEPRPIARGNIARAILYMHLKYGIRISRERLELMTLWNSLDRPSKAEVLRNDIIEKVQGNRNPFIDDPALIKKTGFSMTQ